MTTTFLVQYGRSSFIGRFHSRDPICLARGERVVVRGPHGLELGSVLCEPADRFAPAGAADGELLRVATVEDREAAAGLEKLGRAVLAAAEAGGGEAALPVTFVDVEVTLDRSSATLHGLPWGECDATPLFEGLSQRFGLTVRLLDLSRSHATKEPSHGSCGKAGCGSGGGGCSSCGSGSGGCSTGSCSRGAVKSAGELTAYFAELRGKMEAQSASRTPLV